VRVEDISDFYLDVFGRDFSLKGIDNDPRDTPMSRSFLRLSTVKARTGLSRSTLYRRISEGTFPAAIPLGGRSVGWLDSEVDEWISAQLRLREEAMRR